MGTNIMAKYMSIVQGIVDITKPEFEDIDKLDEDELYRIVAERDDNGNISEMMNKIEQLTAKERESELNNRDRRILKKLEKQKEELDATGRGIAWIEEDVQLAIEEKIEQEEAEEAARQLREK